MISFNWFLSIICHFCSIFCQFWTIFSTFGLLFAFLSILVHLLVMYTIFSSVTSHRSFYSFIILKCSRNYRDFLVCNLPGGPRVFAIRFKVKSVSLIFLGEWPSFWMALRMWIVIAKVKIATHLLNSSITDWWLISSFMLHENGYDGQKWKVFEWWMVWLTS